MFCLHPYCQHIVNPQSFVMISFQEDSTSIVDSWLAKESFVDEELAGGKQLKSNKSTSAPVSGDSRLGLGFTASVNGKDQSKKGDDALSRNLKKGEKKYGQNDVDPVSGKKRTADELRDMHGVVDDLQEESRAALVSVAKPVTKVSVAVNKQPHNLSKKVKPSNPQNNININRTTTSSNDSKKSVFEFKSTSLAVSGDNVPNISADETLEARPKRKKTRSKQKNIRRDNRSDTDKPTHLQVGSKEYKGRPLTAETKAVLGMNVAPSKSQKKKQKQKEKEQRRQEAASAASPSQPKDNSV
jgi:hypothetical protein